MFLLILCVLVLSACSSRNAMYNSQSWPGITADGDTVYTANGNVIEAVKDAKPMLHPLPPLIIYQENGDLTNELKSVYHISE